MLQQQKSKLEIDAKYLPLIKKEGNVLKINAEGLYYRESKHFTQTSNLR